MCYLAVMRIRSFKEILIVGTLFSLLTFSSPLAAKEVPSKAIVSCANTSSVQMRLLKTGSCKKTETRLSFSRSMQVKTANRVCISDKTKVMRYVSAGKCRASESSMLSVYSAGSTKKQSICISKSSIMRYVISGGCTSLESPVGTGSIQELIDLLRSLLGYLTATTTPMSPVSSAVVTIPSITNTVTTTTTAPLPTSTSTTTSSSSTTSTTTTTIPGSFTTGMKVVGGSGIAAGRYLTTSASDSCYWARLSGFGGTNQEIITNAIINVSRTIVDISASDLGFTSSRCGSWVPLSSVNLIPSVISDGVWVVGSEMAAGTWSSSNSGSDSCYWARVRGFGGTNQEIISNYFGSSASLLVTVSSSDTGFTTTRCGTWTKIS